MWSPPQQKGSSPPPHRFPRQILRPSIEVEVERGDLAPGMAEGVFRPFEPEKDKQPSLGLRLAVSRRGIEAAGGSLSARDLTGKGCVFSIELPRMPAA